MDKYIELSNEDLLDLYHGTALTLEYWAKRMLKELNTVNLAQNKCIYDVEKVEVYVQKIKDILDECEIRHQHFVESSVGNTVLWKE